MKLLLTLAACCTLLACTTVNQVQGPNGTSYVVQCGQSRWASCYEAAAESCPSGYVVENQTTHLLEKNSMLVRCK